MLLCENLGLSHEREGSMTVLQIATLSSETANLKVNPQHSTEIERKKTWQETWQKTRKRSVEPLDADEYASAYNGLDIHDR